MGIVFIGMLRACGTPSETEDMEDLGQTHMQIFGSQNQTVAATGPFVRAVARVVVRDANSVAIGGCSGTLIAANKILTARPCFTKISPSASVTNSFVVFADDAGNIPPGAPQFPGTALAFPPAPGIPTEWFRPDTYETEVGPFDMAVLTIGPSTLGTLPNVPSAPVFLGDPFVAVPAARLSTELWVVGYGANQPAHFEEEAGDPGLGSGVRRGGSLGSGSGLKYGIDECGPGEDDCWETRMWVANSTLGGSTAQTSKGDSGGPLFFNVNRPGSVPIVGGVGAVWTSEAIEAQRWAATGWTDNAFFLWQQLGLPFARTAAQQRQNTALLGRIDGTHFDGLILESGSVLRALPFIFPATWVYIDGAGPAILRGNVIANPGRMFIGAPVVGGVNIGASFSGTLVAPNAQIAIENSTLQVQRGSVFGRRVELHQGLIWQHTAFPLNWTPQCTTYSACAG